jgi:hypothetical protein
MSNAIVEKSASKQEPQPITRREWTAPVLHPVHASQAEFGLGNTVDSEGHS